MDSEDDLDILTALLDEGDDVGEAQHGQEQVDDWDCMFDVDGDEEEQYKEGSEEEAVAKEDAVLELFGDVEDIEKEEKNIKGKGGANENPNQSKEDLQEELRKMQKQMQKLQQQLEASQKVPATKTTTAASPKSAVLKPSLTQQPEPRRVRAKAIPTLMQSASTSSSTPVRAGSSNLQESTDFLSQLNNGDLFKRKPRVAHKLKASSPEDRKPLMEVKLGSSFQALESSSQALERLLSPPPSHSTHAPTASAGPSKPAAPLPLPRDLNIEKYSGLRIRRPRVSSSEMDRKMADRRLIRLSQVPERLTREKLEDSDWVTFAVLVNKATPQSNSSGML